MFVRIFVGIAEHVVAATFVGCLLCQRDLRYFLCQRLPHGLALSASHLDSAFKAAAFIGLRWFWTLSSSGT